MTPREELIDALTALVQREGGYAAVADKIDANDQTIYQIVRGVKLPSGQPKGVGPALQAKLEAKFPGWSRLRTGINKPPVAEEHPPRLYGGTEADAVVRQLARLLARMAHDRRAEVVQVFGLLVAHPDETDYLARMAKLLADTEVTRGKRALGGAR